ncbi:hypothetical protein N9N67_04660 [Bacteriovoracaceae bacterium]|nr:hypothetical protein [Bacteriovoracaceae bacterium]
MKILIFSLTLILISSALSQSGQQIEPLRPPTPNEFELEGFGILANLKQKMSSANGSSTLNSRVYTMGFKLSDAKKIHEPGLRAQLSAGKQFYDQHGAPFNILPGSSNSYFDPEYILSLSFRSDIEIIKKNTYLHMPISLSFEQNGYNKNDGTKFSAGLKFGKKNNFDVQLLSRILPSNTSYFNLPENDNGKIGSAKAHTIELEQKLYKELFKLKSIRNTVEIKLDLRATYVLTTFRDSNDIDATIFGVENEAKDQYNYRFDDERGGFNRYELSSGVTIKLIPNFTDQRAAFSHVRLTVQYIYGKSTYRVIKDDSSFTTGPESIDSEIANGQLRVSVKTNF